MSRELDLIARLRLIATDPGARGLADDAALLEVGGARLVLTHDMIVEGVHFLRDDAPESVAAKLVAVNLSDLAAKGARPCAALLGFGLGDDPEWDARFVAGLGVALAAHDLPLLGGDTVKLPAGAPRSLGLTAIGEARGTVPSRAGARVGDALYVTGTIGDAGLGLRIARGEISGDAALLAAYQSPQPQLAAGAVLAGFVTAMMDVSDGLLIDAARLAAASGVAAQIDVDAIPLSPEVRAHGDDRAARLTAASAGDDYQLLFAASLPLPALPCAVTRIGSMVRGTGLQLSDRDGAIDPPERLGWLH